MVTEKIFEAALGISSPWYIAGMNFEPSQRKLMIRVDFEVGSRFAVSGLSGESGPRHAHQDLSASELSSSTSASG